MNIYDQTATTQRPTTTFSISALPTTSSFSIYTIIIINIILLLSLSFYVLVVCIRTVCDVSYI